MALLRDFLPAFVCLFGACALGLDVGTCPPIKSRAAGRVGTLHLSAGMGGRGGGQRHPLVPSLRVHDTVRLRGGGSSSIDAAIDLKNRGNAMFREGRFDEAKTMYDAALESLPKGEGANRERANCYNNRAACHVKLGDFVRCVEDCTAVLDIDPPNGAGPNTPLPFFPCPPRLRPPGEGILSRQSCFFPCFSTDSQPTCSRLTPFAPACFSRRLTGDAAPTSEKARLRRGIAFETLELKGKAAADMVLLLIEKPDQLQARECLIRCVETLPTVSPILALPRQPPGSIHPCLVCPFQQGVPPPPSPMPLRKVSCSSDSPSVVPMRAEDAPLAPHPLIMSRRSCFAVAAGADQGRA